MKSYLKKKKGKLFSKVDDGFSFAETVAVLAIMLILTATVGISAFRYVDKAKTVSAKNQSAPLLR